MKIHKEMDNLELADLMRAIACALEIKGGDKNKFRIIAYERAADAIEHLSSEAKDLYDDNKLSEIPGVGVNIAGYLSDIFKDGKSNHITKILEGIKPSVFELIKLSYVGPKTAFKLSNNLKIDDQKPIDSLEKYAIKGEISKIEGFGKESEKEILQAIKEYKQKSVRHLLNYAENIANEIIDWMKQEKFCEKVDALGSLRRKASTVGDLDISVSTKDKEKTINHFCKYKNAKRIIEKGITTASIILPGNVQVDLMTAKPESYGSLLQHFTGSKHHNIKLREYARSLSPSLNLSEYGIKTLNAKKTNAKKENKIIKFKTEEEFYKYLGMEWIPPEIREGNEEIEMSLSNNIPDLVELSDVKGDLQIHSNFNIETSHDIGSSTFEEIIEKVHSKNYHYIAFTDHNPSHSKHNEDEITEILKRKKEYVEKANKFSIEKKYNLHIFNSLEIDILKDGNLPLTNDHLKLLDFVLVSIHSGFTMNRHKMTERVLSALDNPKVKIFAHPTTRLLNRREGIDLDWERIFDFCLQKNILLEINSDPLRLDLPDYLVKEAIKKGIKLTLGTDSHIVNQMDNIVYGVYVARRGWAEKKDIINTLSLEDVKKVLLS